MSYQFINSEQGDDGIVTVTINDPDAKPADKTVTCGTCHRGNKMPAIFVPKPEAHEHPGGGGMPMQKPQ